MPTRRPNNAVPLFVASVIALLISTAAQAGTGTSADVSIVKSITTPGPYYPGQSITYTLTIHNDGPSSASGVSVDDMPSNMTITHVDGPTNNAFGCLGFPCPLSPAMAVGESRMFTVTATIDSAGAFSNTATANGSEFDPNTANNTDTQGGFATSADVSIVKSITTPGPYYPGQSISYTLTVHNDGPSPASGVSVNDTPSNMTITHVDGPTNNAFGCLGFPCPLSPAMAPGNTRTFTVTATIDSAGAFSNTATANGSDFDPNPANNTDTKGGVASSADVSIVKSITTPGPYYPGQSISYTLTVHNDGPSSASGVSVNDTPSNMTITHVDGPTGNFFGCLGFPCPLTPAMAAGNTRTFTVTATIDSAGAFSNTATANGSDFDPNTANNTDTKGGVASSADVSIVKSITTPGPYYPGQSIVYTLTVHNDGPSPASGVSVNDAPSNMTITHVDGPTGNFFGCLGFPCPLTPAMAPGNTRTFTVTATIDSAGAFSNTATANGSDYDPNTANNTDTKGGFASSADVSIIKSITTPGPYYPGQSISYTLTVHNDGPSPASGVSVNDAPSNMTITHVDGPTGNFFGCLGFPCPLTPAMAAGNTRTFTVTATINSAGAFSNTATANGSDFDPNPLNNTDTQGGVAAASADVSIVKTLTTAGPFVTGQSISYTIQVSNAGPSAATNIQVTDTPTNLTITSVSGAGCSALPCTIAGLAAGANTTINVTATINAAGAFDNGATANATEFDPTLTNNSDSSGNGGIATNAPIPALGDWTLILLATMLAVLGALLMRARDQEQDEVVRL